MRNAFFDMMNYQSGMKMRPLLTRQFLILHSSFLILLSSCSGLRYIPEGQRLYTGSKVIIKSPAKLKNYSALETAVLLALG